MTAILMTLGINLLGALAPALAAGVGALVLKGTALLNAKTTSEKQKQASSRVSQVVVMVVQSLLQTTVGAAKASQGGALTVEQKKEYKTQALEDITKLLGKDQLKDYATVLGIDDVAAWISSQVESALYAAKQGVVQATTSPATDSVAALPPFYKADAQHPAQQAGAPNPINSPPPAAQGVPGR